MTTEAPAAIEFRCNRCWQPNFASLEDYGNAIYCQSCQAVIVVPEPTQDRLRPAEVLRTVQGKKKSAREKEPEILERMTDAQLMKIVRTENHLPISERNFLGYMDASLVMRLLANFLDGLYVGLSIALGFVSVLIAARYDVIDMLTVENFGEMDLSTAIILYFFPLVAVLIQWNLIATRGQSVGKFLTCIRIVTMEGRLPGFIRGVIVRNWVRRLLSLLPLFALFDLLVCFGASRRCIHDFMAGTRVVQG